MLFNSVSFLIFLPCVWLLYMVSKHRAQNILLLVASYIFYGCWDWRFLSLLWISTAVDFVCGLGMKNYPSKRRLLLGASLVTNLGILGTFKYFDFFSASATRLLSELGLQADLPTLNLILPVGISFYTFQTLAYTIDVYRGRSEPTSDLLSFAIYVAYFPQLVAGPIERATHLLPQVQSHRTVARSDLLEGAELCLMGYFRKVFIADSVAPIVDQCFKSQAELGWLGLLVGVYLFAIQIYGDFAGYSDIARGVSRFFGIRLCLNFEQPYLSPSITEFWRRWHISLSAWLRDYLYVPLGGNRKGRVRTYVNNMLTMLLGGLWHGAGWTFVIWGGLHGLYLAVHKLVLRERKVHKIRPPRGAAAVIVWAAKCLLTFNLVCLSWIFFRARSLSNAVHYLKGILTLRPGDFSFVHGTYLIFFGACVLVVDLLCFYREDEVPVSKRWHPAVRGVIYAVMLFLILCLGEHDAQPFIYFQF